MGGLQEVEGGLASIVQELAAKISYVVQMRISRRSNTDYWIQKVTTEMRPLTNLVLVLWIRYHTAAR